jgi:hypothetical protein
LAERGVVYLRMVFPKQRHTFHFWEYTFVNFMIASPVSCSTPFVHKHMPVQACTHGHMHVHVHAHMHLQKRAHAHAHAHTHTHMHVCMHSLSKALLRMSFHATVYYWNSVQKIIPST